MKIRTERESPRRRPMSLRLIARFPGLGRFLIRTSIGLPTGRLRRALARWAARHYIDAFNRRDYELIPSMFHPDGSFEVAAKTGAVLGSHPEQAYRGPEGLETVVREWLDAWGEDFRYELREVIDLGDRLLFLNELSGRGEGSGIELRHREAQLFSFRDGMIFRIQQYWSWDEALHTVGLRE